MALLKRDDILGKQDLPFKDIEVPEWGGTVRVRALTGLERDRFESSVVVQKGNKTSFNPENMRAKLVAMCIIDEDGNRVFSDEDIKALGKKSASALNRVFIEAQKLSGLAESDIEEAEKNSN